MMINYEVDPLLLARRVPVGTELDLDRGRCFVSLVGFMFLDTRVLGIPIPFHINFEEINLRYYVRRDTEREVRRGVVFVKEIVPRFAIASVARSIYGEPYECWKTSNHRNASGVNYQWRKGNNVNSISADRGQDCGEPIDGSHGSFIIEHYWGYTARGVRTYEYRVEHRKWNLYSTKNERIKVDFERTYTRDFAFLSDQKPFSVLLAAGSPVEVFKGGRIR